MGDHSLIYGLICFYCNKEQEEVYYHESAGSTTHKCDNVKCGKISDIKEIYKLVKRKKK